MTTVSSATITVLLFIGGLLIAIIGYFLRKTMDDLAEVERLSNRTKSELDVLQNDHINKHSHLSDKFDDLKDSIVILTKEIKELTSKIK
jgi:superfamily I DNA and RNA helicase